MTKKVIELAKELGIPNKDLIAQAKELGISVKTPASLLGDADVKKIREAMKGAGASPAKAAKPSIGRPIVNENLMGGKNKGPQPKPIVNEKTFDRAAEEPKPEPVKQTAAEEKPAEEPKVKTIEGETEAPKIKIISRPEDRKEEKKEEPKKEAPKKAEPKAEEAPKKTAEPKKQEEPKKEETPKKEPEIKLADSESIATPKIKIVKMPDPKEKEEKKAHSQNQRSRNGGRDGNRSDRGNRNNDRNNGGNRNGERNDRGGRNSGNGGRNGGRPEGNGGGRNDRNGGRSNQAASPQPVSEGRQKNGRKAPVKKEDGRSKFDKFEKRSLEKKERKKYTKQKPDVNEEIEEEILPEGTFKIDVPITIAGFCEQTEVSTSKVIMTLMKMGIMANINQNLDEETVMVLADEIGIQVIVGNVEEEVVEEGIENFTDDEKDLVPRAPIITVMGHVDHGKTSLLDAIRSTNVTSTESGGITQHIGASEVVVNGRRIVFLDTPGHEAFTAMRARGAHVTDIAILVVAADDGVMPQTIESISHAKAAEVPIIVAINKMDKPGANPDRVMKELADQGVLVEDWGGDVISVPVSAKKREGIDDLLEMVLLQADVQELKANPNRLALGTVIEAKLDKARGPVATLLVSNGTLHAGQSIVAGTCSGRIRLMTDAKGKKIHKAGPATAVEVLGLTDVPEAGDSFNAVRDDKTAREIAARRAEKLREETLAKNSSMTLEKLFGQIQEGEVKELNLVIKADVMGSVGAIISSLEKLNTDDVKVNVIHSGVGTVNESDVMLAETSNAVIIGFNVRPSAAVTSMADQKGVEIRLYRVIYDALNDVEAAMKGMLDPDIKEEVLGQATVRETFKVPGVGIIAGSYVTSGKVARNAEVRLVRDGIVIHEGKISSLKRFKDDAKEVNQGYECGIGIEDYNDIKVDDMIECFHMVEVEREL